MSTSTSTCETCGSDRGAHGEVCSDCAAAKLDILDAVDASTTAAPAAGMGPEALPRQLRWPWSGGFVALARTAGIDRIEPGRAPQISRTCAAPMVASAICIFTAAIAA